jgi:aspartate aminotransferase
MFEEGNRLRQQFGADQVYDFSLGNPHLEPPPEFAQALADLALHPPLGLHRYMPNPGFTDVREAIGDWYGKREGVLVPTDHVVMTCGAAGAINVALRAMLEPGDEVILFVPIFAEYRFYVMHARGTCRMVETTDEFDLDLDRLESAIGPRTRAVLINSPNNPTGRVYPEQTILGLCELLERKSKEIGRAIVLITDEPYRMLTYDGVSVPAVMPHYAATLGISSFSKDLGLAGERIGYLIVHPDFPEAGDLLRGLIFCLRTMGFVNAPAIIQKSVAQVLGASVDVDAYRQNRDLFYPALISMGFSVCKPDGAFFLFPKTPIADDVAFVKLLQAERVLSVPGTGFGRPGYIRLSYAVDRDVIERSLPQFEKVMRTIAGA